jgi:hypothetical protein
VETWPSLSSTVSSQERRGRKSVQKKLTIERGILAFRVPGLSMQGFLTGKMEEGFLVFAGPRTTTMTSAAAR